MTPRLATNIPLVLTSRCFFFLLFSLLDHPHPQCQRKKMESSKSRKRCLHECRLAYRRWHCVRSTGRAYTRSDIEAHIHTHNIRRWLGICVTTRLTRGQQAAAAAAAAAAWTRTESRSSWY